MPTTSACRQEITVPFTGQRVDKVPSRQHRGPPNVESGLNRKRRARHRRQIEVPNQTPRPTNRSSSEQIGLVVPRTEPFALSATGWGENRRTHIRPRWVGRRNVLSMQLWASEHSASPRTYGHFRVRMLPTTPTWQPQVPRSENATERGTTGRTEVGTGADDNSVPPTGPSNA